MRGFFDKDMLQLFEIERFLFDHVIPRDREALHEILDALSELKLYGMRASFDEIGGQGPCPA